MNWISSCSRNILFSCWYCFWNLKSQVLSWKHEKFPVSALRSTSVYKNIATLQQKNGHRTILFSHPYASGSQPHYKNYIINPKRKHGSGHSHTIKDISFLYHSRSLSLTLYLEKLLKDILSLREYGHPVSTGSKGLWDIWIETEMVVDQAEESSHACSPACLPCFVHLRLWHFFYLLFGVLRTALF